MTKGNIVAPAAVRTQGRGAVSIGLQGVRRKAQQEKDVRYTLFQIRGLGVETWRGWLFKAKNRYGLRVITYAVTLNTGTKNPEFDRQMRKTDGPDGSGYIKRMYPLS